MSGYNMQYFIEDFAKRTMSNKRIIDAIVNHEPFYDSKAYEVTQLINSLLGLVIMPTEKYKKNVRAESSVYRDCKEKIIHLIKKCEVEKRYYNDYGDKYNVFKIINHLRNSIAHGGNEGLHFYPVQEGGDSVITGVVFYDSQYEINEKSTSPKPDGDVPEFCLSLSINEIEELVEAISTLYISAEKKAGPIKEYNEEMELLNGLLRNGRGDNEMCVAAKIAKMRSPEYD